MGSSPDGAITIRRAEPSDYEGFAAVFEGATAQSQTMQMPFPSREGWRKKLAEAPPNSHQLVALLDGRHVGNAGIAPAHPSPRRAHAAHFGITVHDDFQGRGVGRALMSAIVDLADGWTPFTRLELTVYADNARAIALYRSFGFVEEGLHKGYVLRGGEYVDALCMARIRGKK
jgi:putative acetyltransferase